LGVSRRNHRTLTPAPGDLSFGHEQAHPEGEISWNREAVLAYYAGPPNYWSVAEVEAQVFRKYSGAQVTNFSAYDKTSVMRERIRK
jgi:hypothetical protein